MDELKIGISEASKLFCSFVPIGFIAGEIIHVIGLATSGALKIFKRV